jgi:multiple sugar transport system substrate-binding protein
MKDVHRRSPDPRLVGLPLMTRRSVIHGGVAGLLAAYGLAGCGGDDDGGGGGGGSSAKPTGTVTFGSNYSDAIPKKALQATLDSYQKKSGVKVGLNTVDHNTFQEQINNYLQGDPDDVFAWFAGNRMQFFAQKGLATDIGDVWDEIGDQYSEAFKAASKGLDGKYYFVPFYYYPWAVFYRKSLWKQNGYEPPKTLDEFTALAKKMQSDGLVPLAFADKDGWPAMGTFDYLNMRSNGYDFHISLMSGDESWESTEVKNVFNTWRELLPYHQEGALGRIWQDAAKTFSDKKAGMYVLGLFLGNQMSEKDRKDLDFFPFPEINSEHGQDSVEAPIDGFMMAKSPENEDGAKDLLAYLGGAEAQTVYLNIDPNNIAASTEADTAGYTPIQKKANDLISNAAHISQFMDRDTRPDFASTVMIPAIQQFLRDPNDVDGLTKSIEQQKKTIFV